MPETASKTQTDLAAELAVSGQTLKNWTRDFSPFLSAPGALGDANRRFTEDDVFVLKRIKDHLAAGLTFAETAEELRRFGVNVTEIPGDVSDPGCQRELLAACPAPDILVNNNGGPPRRDFRELDREAIGYRHLGDGLLRR